MDSEVFIWTVILVALTLLKLLNAITEMDTIRKHSLSNSTINKTWYYGLYSVLCLIVLTICGATYLMLRYIFIEPVEAYNWERVFYIMPYAFVWMFAAIHYNETLICYRKANGLSTRLDMAPMIRLGWMFIILWFIVTLLVANGRVSFGFEVEATMYLPTLAYPPLIVMYLRQCEYYNVRGAVADPFMYDKCMVMKYGFKYDYDKF